MCTCRGHVLTLGSQGLGYLTSPLQRGPSVGPFLACVGLCPSPRLQSAPPEPLRRTPPFAPGGVSPARSHPHPRCSSGDGPAGRSRLPGLLLAELWLPQAYKHRGHCKEPLKSLLETGGFSLPVLHRCSWGRLGVAWGGGSGRTGSLPDGDEVPEANARPSPSRGVSRPPIRSSYTLWAPFGFCHVTKEEAAEALWGARPPTLTTVLRSSSLPPQALYQSHNRAQHTPPSPPASPEYRASWLAGLGVRGVEAEFPEVISPRQAPLSLPAE